MLLIVPILLNVAFLTLLERKILGLSQSRKGPNKVALMGLIQPFADAMKLLSKQSFEPWSANSLMFQLAPFLALTLSLVIWNLAPLPFFHLSWELAIFWLLIFMGLGLYPLLLAGWSSNSQYALLGAMRGVAQTISYEISLALILFNILILVKSLSFLQWFYTWGFFTPYLAFILVVLWVIVALAESNRTPFDFSEGESELVSGFNIEYGAFGFTLLFLAEYASILFLSYFTSMLAFHQMDLNLTTAMSMLFLAYFWIWLRATLPRHRYDLLMNLAWKSMLPLTLAVTFFFISLIWV